MESASSAGAMVEPTNEQALQPNNNNNSNDATSTAADSAASAAADENDDGNVCVVQRPGGSGKRPKGEALVICGSVGSDPNNASLQDSFKKFLTQKKRERAIQKMCRDNAATGEGNKRTDTYKDSLRHKFIEQAKSYIGVPYAERYKAPEDPIAPLYLDCCGLVRQAVKDLQEDFGFIVGRWNQCYQMDTLPIVLEEKDLKPGDLIFYEGKFNSPRHKPQKHNNVHVEIFLGGETGEGTIGSRYQRGKVGIFPSYKFKSTTWDLVQYHFRSIDTWLDGVCKSCCPEHKWESDLLAIEAAAGKRSIFADNDDEDDVNADSGPADDDIQIPGAAPDAGSADAEEDCGGGGGGDGSDSETDDAAAGGQLTLSAAAIVKAAADAEAAEISLVSGSVDSNPEKSKPAGAVETPVSVAAQKSPKKQPPKAISSRSRSFDESNSPIKTSASAAAVGSNRFASPSKSASVKQPTLTESPVTAKAASGKAAGTTSRRARGVASSTEVNTSLLGSSTESLEGVLGSSTGSLTASAELEGSTGAPGSVSAKLQGRSRVMSSSLESLAKSTKQDCPLTYYVAKANGWQLVKQALDKRGWQQLPFEYNFSTRFGLKWVERRSQIDYKAHTPGQLVCHIPNNEIICSKVSLLQTMREFFVKPIVASASGSSTKRRNPPWLPETYLLNQPGLRELDSPCNVFTLFVYFCHTRLCRGR
jgi:hypothetical protein